MDSKMGVDYVNECKEFGGANSEFPPHIMAELPLHSINFMERERVIRGNDPRSV